MKSLLIIWFDKLFEYIFLNINILLFSFLYCELIFIFLLFQFYLHCSRYKSYTVAQAQICHFSGTWVRIRRSGNTLLLLTFVFKFPTHVIHQND